MKTAIDLREGCQVYSNSIQNALRTLLDVEVEGELAMESNASFEGNELYVSILFTGQVYGEFIVGLTKKAALEILRIPFEPGKESEAFHRNREEVLDSFKEVVNIAAGKTLSYLKNFFPEVTITPPRSIEGMMSLASFDIKKIKLFHRSGGLNCYIYLDSMKLDIAGALEKGKLLLSQEQLKHEELERLNKSKTEFLANMSHELRTPLNGIIGMLEVMKTTNLDDVQRDQLSLVCRSGDFLLSIINDILEFSKIESGKLEIESRPFNLVKSIEGVVETLASEVYSKGLDFHLDLDPALFGTFEGDETRLKQVLMNLIGNAIKFTPTGYVALAADAISSNRIRIRVTDSGVGIPASKLKAIFDSFSQADVSDTRRYGGSGLGLTISRSIVRAMGGELTVTSQEARGSEFTIEFSLNRIVDSQKVPKLKELAGNFFLFGDSLRLSQSVRRQLHGLAADNSCSQITPEVLAQIKSGDVVLIDWRSWQKTEYPLAETMDKIRASNAFVVFLVRPREVKTLIEQQKSADWSNFNYLTLPLAPNRLEILLTEKQTLNLTRSKVKFNEPTATTAADIRKVLLVEDNQVNQIVVSSMLSLLKFNVVTAEDGAQALKKMETESFDLVLMDCQMPIMDGYEATRRIRLQDQKNSMRTPVLAITANAFRETKEKCFECGMDDFVTKPLKFEQLKEAIERTLAKVSDINSRSRSMSDS